MVIDNSSDLFFNIFKKLLFGHTGSYLRHAGSFSVVP